MVLQHSKMVHNSSLPIIAWVTEKKSIKSTPHIIRWILYLFNEIPGFSYPIIDFKYLRSERLKMHDPSKLEYFALYSALKCTTHVSSSAESCFSFNKMKFFSQNSCAVFLYLHIAPSVAHITPHGKL